jgi:hypothetical protein
MTTATCRLAFAAVLSVPLIGGCGFFGEPDIQVNCSINKLGTGSCTFTNIGDGSGAECGRVTLTQQYLSGESRSSELICSGKMEPSSTVVLDVSVSGARGICGHTTCGYSWDSASN